MTFKNKTVQKFISLFLILAILSPAAFVISMPKQTKADIPVVDIPNLFDIIKNIVIAILKAFLRKVASKLLDKMTQSTINWINTGFKGAPLFVENPKSFFKNVVHTELRGFINETAYDPIKFPFGTDYAQSILDKARGSFAQNAQYSLSKMNLDAAEFQRQQNDFAAGGWGGLLMNTQQIQNNFLGYQIAASNEVDRRLTGTYSAPQKTANTLSQGSGFLSQLKCASNTNWTPNPPETEPAPTDPEHAAWEAQYGCPEGPTSVTPGRAAADTVMTALGSKQRQGELSQQAGNALAAIFDAVINKFIDAGLSAVSNAVAGSGNPPTADPLDVKLKDFNQYGDKGNGEPGGYLGGPPTATAPHVSVTVNIINDDGGQTYDPGILQAYLDDNAIKTNTPVSVGLSQATIDGDLSEEHHVTLQELTGYYQIITGDCDKEGNVWLKKSLDTTCVFTLDDIPGNSDRNSGYMIVQVNVINDDEAKYLIPAITGDKLGVLVNGSPRIAGVSYKYPEGWADVSVTLPDKGYTLTWTAGCNANGQINIQSTCTNGVFGVGSTCDGDVNICTVTLNDIPGWHQHKMKVDVVVINDAAVPGTLTANGVQVLVDNSTQTVIPPVQTIASGPMISTYNTDVPPKLLSTSKTGIPNLYTAGDTKTAPTHIVTGPPVTGYTVEYDGDCDSKGEIQLLHTLDANDVKTCTVTYDDIN